MKTWQKILLPTAITLLIGSFYLFIVWKHRQDPGVIGRQQDTQSKNMDDYVVMRAMMPAYFEHLARLNDTTVWMKNGYTISYFPYEGGRIQFAHPVGTVPSAQKLTLKKFIKAVPPATLDDGISHGDRQAFAIFVLPNDPKLYAMAVGAIEGSQEGYFCDALFFYDDPHTIYSHWPKDVWAAIDARQVKPGMSERQTRMAIGQQIDPDSRERGNRTVRYDQNGKKWTVTYVNDRATIIKQQ